MDLTNPGEDWGFLGFQGLGFGVWGSLGFRVWGSGMVKVGDGPNSWGLHGVIIGVCDPRANWSSTFLPFSWALLLFRPSF